MSRSIEDTAKSFLLRDFTHAIYSFADKRSGDKGFDLWLIDKEKNTEQKIELKAHGGIYRRPSNLVERLIFSAEIERQLFEQGENRHCAHLSWQPALQSIHHHKRYLRV